MISKTLGKFKTIPKETKSLVFLYWVYEFAGIIVSVFLGIFVFLQTKSLVSLAIYNLIFFTGILLGFTGWGLVMARLQISMRLNFFRSFAIYIISFLILIFLPNTFSYLLLFGLLNGFALGMFWLGMHAYELLLTKSVNRDFYSSMQRVGTATLKIAAPLVATITFYISEKVLHVDTFKLLFTIIPFIYLLSAPFIFNLPDFTPEKISMKEIKRLATDKKIGKARQYFFTSSFGWGLHAITIPIIAILSLKTVINIGVLQTAIGLVAILSIVFLSHKRHEGNRIKVFLYSIIIGILSYSLLYFWEASPYLYILYTLVAVINDPTWGICEHVISLHGMELMKEKEHTSFFSGMLYREMILYIGRILMTVLIALIAFLLNEKTALISGLTLIIITSFITWYAAKRMIEQKN